MLKKQVTAQIDEDIFKEINNLATVEDCSTARIIRKILNKWYKEEFPNEETKPT